MADLEPHMPPLSPDSGARKLYGAVAALRYESDADVCAKKKGMYVMESREGLFSVRVAFQTRRN